MKGWISLHRQIRNHWLWQEKPFTRGQAWVDILLSVNHDDAKVFMDGELIDIRRGEHITSEPILAEKWGWSRTKIRNFLKILETESMIKNKKEGRKRTRLIVCNYNDYQVVENNRKTTEEQQKDNRNTTEKQQENINNNENNDNNDNKNKYIVFFDTYNNQNIILHKALTSKMKQAINRALNKNSEEDILEAIKRYGIAFKDPEYQFCKYKMTLDKFLTQGNGYYDWLDEGEKWINYSDFKKGANAKKDTQQLNHKTKFHLVKSRGDKYTADELEEIILNNQRNRLERIK